MKVVTKIISLIMIVIGGTFALVGCNPFDNGSTAYLTKKMNEIPIEFEGYELSTQLKKPYTYHFNGQVDFYGSLLEIQYGYTIENKYFNDYLVTYKNKTLYINDEFMRQKSQTYVKISQIWRGFSKEYDDNFCRESEILGVYPFDGYLFIVTDGIETRVVTINCQGCVPITLYTLDLETEEVLYAGYYQDYTKSDLYLNVVKKEDV